MSKTGQQRKAGIARIFFRCAPITDLMAGADLPSGKAMPVSLQRRTLDGLTVRRPVRVDRR